MSSFQPRGEYLSSIEGRILRMEALLKSSGIITNSSPMAPLNSPSPSSEGQVVLTPNNKLSNLVIKDSGKNEYIGMAKKLSPSIVTTLTCLRRQGLHLDSRCYHLEVWHGLEKRRDLID